MAVDHNNPQSRDEEILIATIDGTEYNKNPQSRIEELLLELKEVIEEGGGGGGGGIRPIGVTTTPLYDGATTNPIQINGESYTAETGDMVTYQSTEFLFNVNEVWQELGDVSVVLAIIDDIFADIAPAFDATSTYAVGDYVIYSDQLYRCTTAHTGAWDANDFTETTVSDEITDVETALAAKQDALTAGDYIDISTQNEIKVRISKGIELHTYRFITQDGGYAMKIEKYVKSEKVSENTYQNTSSTTPINIDDVMEFGYRMNGYRWWYKLLVASHEHYAGQEVSWQYNETVDISENFDVSSDESKNIVLQEDLTNALSGKQDTLTFDNAPTENSNNPVKSGGVYSALADKATMLTGVTTPTQSEGEDGDVYLKLGFDSLSFKYIRFKVNTIKSGSLTQMARFKFWDSSDNALSYPTGTQVVSDPSSTGAEGVQNLITDSGKFLVTGLPTVTFTFPDDALLDLSTYIKYGWYTANDQPSRDPVSWELSASNDGTTWLSLDSVVNAEVPDTRSVLAFKGEYKQLGATKIENIYFKDGSWIKDQFAKQNEVESALALKANASDVTTALALKQNATDNSLETTAKTIIGAINEHEGDIGSLKSGFTTLDNEVNGDATVYPYADVITIPDAVPANLADCSVKIEPVQDLHGYDKPWVGGAGKNKLPLTIAKLKEDNTNGTWNGNVYSYRGIDFTITEDNGGNVIEIDVNGTSNADFTTLSLKNAPITQGSYKLNGISNGSQTGLRFDLEGIGDYKTLSNGELSVDVDTDAEYKFSVSVRTSGTTVSHHKVYPMIRLATETDATFAPYTNICPISGHTEAVVKRFGANLYAGSAFLKSAGNWYSDNILQRPGASDLTITSNKVSGTAGGYRWIAFPFEFKKDVKVYCVTTLSEIAASRVFNSSGAQVSGLSGGYTPSEDFSGYIGFGINDGTYDFYFGVGLNSNLDVAHEPSKLQQYTLALGDTIYGGKVRIDSKGNTVMDVDRAIVDLGTLNWAKSSLSGHERYYVGLSSALTAGNIISDCFDYCDYDDLYNHVRDNVISINTGSASVEVYSTYYLADYDATQFKTAMDGHYACYELATPLTVQLTPEQIQLLQGTNTLYASTGDISVTVNGVSGAIGAVQEQVNGLAEEVALKQNATDNSLETTAKTIIGAINEHEGDIGSLKSGLTNVDVALDVPDWTGKNLLNSTLNSYSLNGVTITKNNDGTYRLSGTATSTVWGGPIGSVKLKAGTYKLVGWNPNTPGIKNAVMLYIYDHTSINDYGQGGTTFTLEEETTYSVNFVINNGTTIDTVIKPMITEDINATYSDFAPYIPSVDARLDAVENGVAGLTTTFKVEGSATDLSLWANDNGVVVLSTYITAIDKRVGFKRAADGTISSYESD